MSPPKEKPSLSLPLPPLSVTPLTDESLARRVTRRDPRGSDARDCGVLEEGDELREEGEARTGVRGREESD